VHKLICQGTLEERIHAMLQEKRHLADAVVSTGDAWIAELDDRSLHALVALGDDAVMEEE
jgi:SNF2 family DNA or RNA helicase